MDDCAARLGVNEALFRAVNERIQALNETFSAFTGTFEVVCECGDLDCAQPITVAPAAYERVRTGMTLFIVVPGHETTEVEEVVDEQGAYRIVRKHGRAQRVAEQTKPEG